MDVASILDRHYLGGRTALAEAAIRKLERAKEERKSQTVSQTGRK
jgi:hypothetical protein